MSTVPSHAGLYSNSVLVLINALPSPPLPPSPSPPLPLSLSPSPPLPLPLSLSPSPPLPLSLSPSPPLLLFPSLQVIHGSITEDREKVLENSKVMGFLTGYESKVTSPCPFLVIPYMYRY